MGQPGNVYLNRVGYNTFWKSNTYVDKKRQNQSNFLIRKLLKIVFRYSVVSFVKYFRSKYFFKDNFEYTNLRYYRRVEVINRHINMKAIIHPRTLFTKTNNSDAWVLETSNWLFIMWNRYNSVRSSFKMGTKHVSSSVERVSNFRKYNIVKYFTMKSLKKKKIKLSLI